MTTHYETLGVEPDAAADDIKAAYKRLALETHPDRQGGDEAAFKAVNEAYEVLSDEDLRAEYDAGGDAWIDRVNEELWNLLLATMNEDMLKQRLGDFIRTARDQVKQRISAQENRTATVMREKERMQTMVGRITTTEKRNLFEEILVARLTHCDAQTMEYAEDIRLLQAVLARLATYSDKASFQNDLKFPSSDTSRFLR